MILVREWLFTRPMPNYYQATADLLSMRPLLNFYEISMQTFNKLKNVFQNIVYEGSGRNVLIHLHPDSDCGGPYLTMMRSRILSSYSAPAIYRSHFSCDQAALWMVQSVRLSVRPSVCLSVTPFWLCSHHRIIMKFSGVITSDKSDVHARGQKSRSQRSQPNLTVSGL